MIKKRKTMCETKVYYVSKQVFSSCLLVFFNYNYNLTSPFKFLLIETFNPKLLISQIHLG